MFKFLGKTAHYMAYALLFVVFANAVFQFYTHKTTSLTAWKGGGFGMYTDSHPNHRSVWLLMQGNGGVAEVRLYPKTDLMKKWQDHATGKSKELLERFSNDASQLRYYPRKPAAEDLIKTAARINWFDDLLNGVTPNEGVTFGTSEIKLVIYEYQQDMPSGTVFNTQVFEAQIDE